MNLHFCRCCDVYISGDRLDADRRHRCGQPTEQLRPTEARALERLSLNADRRKLERAYRTR